MKSLSLPLGLLATRIEQGGRENGNIPKRRGEGKTGGGRPPAQQQKEQEIAWAEMDAVMSRSFLHRAFPAL